MPDSAEAHNNLGIALASLGEIEGAIDHFQQALRLQPAFVDAQQNLAKLRGN
jgi:Flp pilus assembly protein TadD